MARTKLRVLMDLSMACRGYCGIAQDVRLLYRTLASCAELEVTGLVYPPQKFAVPHRFCSPLASRADRLANQAEFLWKLHAGGVDWRGTSRWSISHLRGLAGTLWGRSVQWDRLDVELLGHPVWRELFSPTLPATEIAPMAEGRFLLSNLSDGMVYARALSNRRPMKLDTRGYDFLIVQGPRPFRVHRDTRQIVRYHDMIPVLEPDTMGNPLVIAWHHKAIRQSPRSYYVCNSEPTREHLTSVYPELAERSATIPYLLSDVFRRDPNARMARAIMEIRHSTATEVRPGELGAEMPRYLMCVSTLEPRKNFVNLIQAFYKVKALQSVQRQIGDLKLLIVGSPGWKYQSILEAMRAGVRRGELIHLERVTSDELRVLYTHAEAFAFPSYAEGFGFPPLEAMQCESPVVVSDIPQHRWVMGDAALYCDPYDVQSIVDAIERLIVGEQAPALRADMIARGRRRVALYSAQRSGVQWLDLLHRLRHDRRVLAAA